MVVTEAEPMALTAPPPGVPRKAPLWEEEGVEDAASEGEESVGYMEGDSLQREMGNGHRDGRSAYSLRGPYSPSAIPVPTILDHLRLL